MMMPNESYQFHILVQMLVPNVAYHSSLLLSRREMKKCIQKVSTDMLGMRMC